MELPDGGSVQESMGAPTRSAATVVATLAVSGILASPALGDQCAVEIRWNNVLYENWEARSVELEPTRSLGDAEIPHCAAGGRCAPPEETVAAYAIAGVPTEAAILAPDYYEELFLAPGTFPQLRDHPLHEAIFGLPDQPRDRAECGGPFTFEGVVTSVAPSLRVETVVPEVDGLEEGGDIRLQLDSGTRVEGFDRDGVATLAPGDEIVVTARMCQADLAGPLADTIESGDGR